MQRAKTIRAILMIEVAAFLLVSLAIWLDELLDLPHLLYGTMPMRINYYEAASESLAVLLLGVVIVFVTRRYLQRIAVLEELLPICMFCKKIRKPGADPERQESWEAVEHYVHERTGTQFSHGFCPECGMKHYGEVLREDSGKV